ncbi:MAG TPA: MFS transporter, partial [bacterium]|nr:MFS transporter [bacterium]
GRAGERAVLGGGLAWFGGACAGLGAAVTFTLALAWVAVAGVGAGAYHPIATNRIARLADPRRRGRAVGALNVAGDIGKFALPAAAGGLATLTGWRESIAILGTLGVAVGVAYLWAHRRPTGADPGASTAATDRATDASTWWGIRRPRAFAVMTSIGVIDQGTRSAALTFLPFLLVARGYGKAEVGGLFAVMTLGGAAGKFACGWLTDLIGDRPVIIATEVVTAAGTIGLLWLHGAAVFAVYLIGLGVVLNGTSSVLYAGVANLVDQARGQRGYGAFYTVTFLGSAIAPAAYGVLADRAGLAAVFWGLGLVTLTILPLALLLPGRGRSAAGRIAPSGGG